MGIYLIKFKLISVETMDTINRKDFFKKMGVLGLGAISASTLVTACAGGEQKAPEAAAPAPAPEPAPKMASSDPCSDLTGLTDAEKSGRDALGYIAKSEKEGQVCTNCNFWVAAEGDSPCGGCQLMKGPINPDGWCKSWFEKKA